MIIVLMVLIPSKIYINGDKVTNNSTSLLTNKIIRPGAGDGKRNVKNGEKMQNSASIHKKDHAKIRSILIKISHNPKNSVRESKGMHASGRKRRVHLTTVSSEQSSYVSLE